MATLHSCVAINGVPIERPSAPKSNVSTACWCVTTPPAEITGRVQLAFKRGINSEASDVPGCPPALLLTAISASAPNFSTFWAYFKSTTSQKTLMPLEWQVSITSFGLPSEVMTKATFKSTTACNCCFNFGFDLLTIRLIPKGLSVCCYWRPKATNRQALWKQSDCQ